MNITLLGLKYLEGELGKNGSNLLGDVNDVLEDVKSSCGIAVDILNDLLLYEKLDDGIFTLSMTEVPFKDFFMDAVHVFKVQALSFDIDFTVDCLELDNVVVNIDRMKFSQVLRNLISNALKFTPKKGKVTIVGSIVKNFQYDETIIFADSLSMSSSSQSVPSDAATTPPCSASSSPPNTSNSMSSILVSPLSSSEELMRSRSFSDASSARLNLSVSSSDIVHTSSKQEKGFLRICITDTGPGINKVINLQFINCVMDVISPKFQF